MLVMQHENPLSGMSFALDTTSRKACSHKAFLRHYILGNLVHCDSIRDPVADYLAV